MAYGRRDVHIKPQPRLARCRDKCPINPSRVARWVESDRFSARRSTMKGDIRGEAHHARYGCRQIQAPEAGSACPPDRTGGAVIGFGRRERHDMGEEICGGRPGAPERAQRRSNMRRNATNPQIEQFLNNPAELAPPLHRASRKGYGFGRGLPPRRNRLSDSQTVARWHGDENSFGETSLVGAQSDGRMCLVNLGGACPHLSSPCPLKRRANVRRPNRGAHHEIVIARRF